MSNNIPKSWMLKLPVRFGLGLILCANYSCSTSKSMMSQKDPFLKSSQPLQAASGPDDPLLQGNHNLLANKGTPLNSQNGPPGAGPGPAPADMSPEQLKQMQAMQQQAAQQQALAKQQQDVLDQYAALQASMPKPTPEDDSATVRVAKEWPALPEKRIGLAPPDVAAYEDVQGQLPPGGYERPLSEQDPWPMAKKSAGSAAIAQNEETPAEQAPSNIQQVSYDAAFKPTTSQTPASSEKSAAVEQAFEEEESAGVERVTRTASLTTGDTEFTPAEPRVPTHQASMQQTQWADPFCPPAQAQAQAAACPPFPGQGAACEACDPAFYPDEYLCDGGDRGLPVHYSPGTRNGLETQDTIVEYQDETGEQHMKKSNEVCVYAPRFAAVKTTTGSSENLGIDRALGAYESVNGLAVNTRMKPGTEEKTEQVNAARVRSRVSGLETESITLGVNQATKLTDHTKLQNTNTDYGFTGYVGLEKAQTPVTMAGIQAAAVWTRKQSPVIIASDVAGSELHSWFRPEEMVGLEDKSRPGAIYIDKSADRSDAQPGDVITFTIRYKNTGDRSLFNVQLIDNLTPRLEFIEGTATSDRNGRLVVEDNQEGSLILKWEITEEIKGRTGGTATFQARVR